MREAMRFEWYNGHQALLYDGIEGAGEFHPNREKVNDK